MQGGPSRHKSGRAWAVGGLGFRVSGFKNKLLFCRVQLDEATLQELPGLQKVCRALGLPGI